MKWLHLLWLLHSVISQGSAFYQSSSRSSSSHHANVSSHGYLPVNKGFRPINTSTVINHVDAPKTSLLLSSNQNEKDDEEKNETEVNSQRQGNNKEGSVLLPATIISTIAIVASIGTLWSEYSVLMTGCGPKPLPDVVERSCYLGVLTIAGSSVFLRIVTGGNGLAATIQNSFQSNSNNKQDEDTIVIFQMKIAEWMSLFAVAGAFVALESQSVNGEQMDGLSGINVEMCRAIQQVANDG